MKRMMAVILMMILLMSTACADESVRRVFVKGEVPDIPQEEILLELFAAPTVGSDGMLMISGGQTMVVDTCTDSQYPKLRKIIREQGIGRIDYAFNTHPDYDHIGGMKKLIVDFEVGCMMTAYPEKYAHGTMQQGVVKAVKKAGVPIVTIADGDVIDFGNAKLTVIRQTRIKTTPNQLSAMLMVQVGECRMLLTGDAENKAQRVFVEEHYDLKADIMKYPHHGTSKIEPAFIEAVNPEAVFIPHSFTNSKNAHKSLDMYGIPYGVTSMGTIHIMTNGEYWVIDHQVPEEKQKLLQKYGVAF